jgi:GntR family transcriptional regulator/MocR family aminotransferase
MTTLPSGLPVVVDRTGPAPLAVQISAQLQGAVASGVLRAGDRLPSSRDLAATLGVSRTVVTNAYARLFAEGWLEGRHGSGTYVADVTPPPPSVPAAPPAPGSIAQVASIEALNRANEPNRGLAGERGGGSGGADVQSDTEQDHVLPGHLISPPGSSLAGSPVASRGLIALGPPASLIGPIARSGSMERAESANEPDGRAAAPPTARQRGLIDLQPGISWAEGIEPAVWRRAWRQAGAHLPSRWPDPHGLPELRAEIAAYLRRSRGLAVTPAHILITQGVSSGLALLADALLAPGDRAGVEEPGYATAREVLRRAGAEVVPCRVDAHGILPEELPGDLRLLYTTPAHQYPLGGRLPVSRRQALVAWARAAGALVVEDDYDSEFRYDVGPLPALHSMDPDVIVYLGTASKVLATAFGAGWLVAPPELVDKLADLRPRLGVRIPEPVQHAVLALLRSGDLERHVRRMRLEYARRRAALVDALTHADRDGAGENPARAPFRLLGDTAGMHVVLEFPDDYPAVRLVEAAAQRGVAIYPLDRYFAGKPTMNGLILGYGTATLPQIRRAAAQLAQLLSRLP